MYIEGVVIKVASRCNLNCSYCYVYNQGDDSFLSQPKVMLKETYLEFFEKLKKYLETFNKTKFLIVFHGGEPLLAGKDFYRDFIATAKLTLEGFEIIFGMQSNGVLISDDWSMLLNDLDINVGISLDVTKESNDKFRIYKNGKSGYEKIVKGLKKLYEYNNNGGGVLSVIDENTIPKEVYKHFKELDVRSLNLLFLDKTHDDEYNDDLTLGKWLSDIFDIWINDEKRYPIEQFEKLMNLMLGLTFINDEYYGMGRPNTFILETDGEMQVNDPIRVCKNGFSKTKFNIQNNEIHDLYQIPIGFMYYNNHQNLCEKCESCEIKDICGGGYVINRYSTENGFDNPSVFCKSLAYFITHVQNHLINCLPENVRNDINVEKLNFSDLEPNLNNNVYEPNPFLQSFK